MFGVSSYTEGDSDDEHHGQNGMKFAPQYISYTLVDSKHQQSGNCYILVFICIFSVTYQADNYVAKVCVYAIVCVVLYIDIN